MLKNKYSPNKILAALLISAFAGMFSETSLNIALTNLMVIFKVDSSTVQWITTIYLLTLGIIMPFSALFIKMFTTRKLFLFSTLNLLLGTLIGGVSFNFYMLILARVIQAIGMGILLPLMFNTVLLIFDKNKRGQAMGTLGLVLSFAPALGPAISGFLIQYISWRFIFFILLPFILIGIVIGYNNIQNLSETQKQKIDITSVISSVIGFGGLVYGINNLESASNFKITIITLIIAICSLTLFITKQIKSKSVVDLSVFKYPLFILGITFVMLCIWIFQGTMIILPMYLQNGAGFSVLVAGLILLPGSMTNGFLQMFSGKVFDKYGYKALVLPGLAVILITLYLLTLLTPKSSILLIILLDIVLMGGIASVWTGSQTLALNQLPSNLYSHGSTIINTLLQVVGAIGVAISVTIFTLGKNSYLSTSVHQKTTEVISNSIAFGASHVFILFMFMTLVCFIISLFIPMIQKRQ